jgi:hypothetical protein
MALAERIAENRRQAEICYEIAATLTGERASSMARLGDSYAMLAVVPNGARTHHFSPSRYVDPLCRTCGKKMQLTHFLPGAGNAPPMQTFRCTACGEVQGLATKARDPSLPKDDDQRFETHHVAAAFRRTREGLVPGLAVECPDDSMAIRRAELMLREKKVVGAVAFSRRVHPVTGAFKTAVLLKALGQIPKGFER